MFDRNSLSASFFFANWSFCLVVAWKDAGEKKRCRPVEFGVQSATWPPGKEGSAARFLDRVRLNSDGGGRGLGRFWPFY